MEESVKNEIVDVAEPHLGFIPLLDTHVFGIILSKLPNEMVGNLLLVSKPWLRCTFQSLGANIIVKFLFVNRFTGEVAKIWLNDHQVSQLKTLPEEGQPRNRKVYLKFGEMVPLKKLQHNIDVFGLQPSGAHVFLQTNNRSQMFVYEPFTAEFVVIPTPPIQDFYCDTFEFGNCMLVRFVLETPDSSTKLQVYDIHCNEGWKSYPVIVPQQVWNKSDCDFAVCHDHFLYWLIPVGLREKSVLRFSLHLKFFEWIQLPLILPGMEVCQLSSVDKFVLLTLVSKDPFERLMEIWVLGFDLSWAKKWVFKDLDMNFAMAKMLRPLKFCLDGSLFMSNGDHQLVYYDSDNNVLNQLILEDFPAWFSVIAICPNSIESIAGYYKPSLSSKYSGYDFLDRRGEDTEVVYAINMPDESTYNLFTWKILNISNFTRHESDTFSVCGHEWQVQILVADVHLGIYLECLDVAGCTNGRSSDIHYSMVVINQTRDDLSLRQYGQHMFSAMSTRVGSIMPLWALKYFLVDDCLIIEVVIDARRVFAGSSRPRNREKVFLETDFILPENLRQLGIGDLEDRFKKRAGVPKDEMANLERQFAPAGVESQGDGDVKAPAANHEDIELPEESDSEDENIEIAGGVIN